VGGGKESPGGLGANSGKGRSSSILWKGKGVEEGVLKRRKHLFVHFRVRSRRGNQLVGTGGKELGRLPSQPPSPANGLLFLPSIIQNAVIARIGKEKKPNEGGPDLRGMLVQL